MGVTNITSSQLADGYRGGPFDDHGKMRFQYFEVPAIAAQGDIGSKIDLCNLPFGRIRVLPSASKITNSAYGAGATLDVGTRAYQTKDVDEANEIIAEDGQAFVAGLDCAAAGDSVSLSGILKYDLFSKSGVKVFATVQGAAMPVGATLSGYIAYIAD